MKTSEKIDQIAGALVKAQQEMEGAAKDRQGNYGAYATLASVVHACKGPLTAHGITYVQTFEPGEPGRLTLTTALIHVSGQFISGTCCMPLGKADPQGFGSASTYARRYGLAAIVGVAPEDDDGESAMDRGRPAARQAPRQQPQAKRDDLEDAKAFKSALHSAFKARAFAPADEKAAVEAVCKGYAVKSLEELGLDLRHVVLGQVIEGRTDKYKAAGKPEAAPASA